MDILSTVQQKAKRIKGLEEREKTDQSEEEEAQEEYHQCI